MLPKSVKPPTSDVRDFLIINNSGESSIQLIGAEEKRLAGKLLFRRSAKFFTVSYCFASA